MPIALLALLACTDGVTPDKGADDTGQGCVLEQIDPGPAFEHVIDGVADECEVQAYLQTLDSRFEGGGPWHQDLFVSRTPDAHEFDIAGAKLIFEQAAVGEVFLGPDERFYLYFGTGDLDLGRQLALEGSDWMASHGLIGFGALMMAVSDDGDTWELVDDFGIEGVTRGMVIDPDIIVLPDGRYRLFYVGLTVPELVDPESWVDGAEHSVFSAISDDLVHWAQEGEVVRGPIADPTVACMGPERCLMASTGIDWAHSEDGTDTFTFSDVDDPWGFGPEFLATGEGGMRLLYNTREQGGALWSARTTDGGDTWEPEGELIAPRTVEAPSFAPDPAGGLLMVYHYWMDGYSGDSWGEQGSGSSF